MPDNSFKYYNTAWRTIKTPKYYDGVAWRTATTIKYYDGASWRIIYLAALAPTITSQPTTFATTVSVSSQPTNQTYTASAPSISVQPTAQTSNAGTPTISVQPTNQTATPSQPDITVQPTSQTTNAGTPTISSQPTSQTSNAGTPSISGQPSSSTVTAGATASFSITASSPDGGSLGYQWQRSTDGGSNFSNVTTGSGGTTASYTTETTTTGMSNYRYRCVVTNTKANNNTFTITPNTSPDGGSITTLWFLNGSSTGVTTTSYSTSTAGSVFCRVTNTKANFATFSLTASSPDGGTLSYQWYFNGSQIGTNSPSYSTPASSSNIYCIVTNTRTPSNTFSVTASSPDSGSLSYLWFLNGSSTGTTATSYTTSSAGSVYCRVRNTKSNNNTFSVTASAGGTLSYLWFLNSASTGVTTQSYSTNSAGTVFCRLTNSQTGNVTFNATGSSSTSGTISYLWFLNGSTTGITTSSYTTSTASSNIYCQITATNSSNTFSVSATGNGTLTYQWYVNGGASGTSTTQSVSTGGGASVYCAVTNTRNGSGLTTNSNTVTNTLSAVTNTNTVTSTTSGTASVDSSSVSSTVNTTTDQNTSTVTSTINTINTRQSNTVTSTVNTTASVDSTTVTSTVNTTATATSSSATLTVNAAVTDVRPNGFPVGANSGWLNSGNTVDGSFGDTTTYGNPQRVGGTPFGDWVGNADLTWASQATTSSTLYLQYGYESEDWLASGITAGIYYSTNAGSSYTQIAAFTADGGSSTADAYQVALPASVNLSNVRVKAEVHTYKDGFDIDFVKVRVYDAYIQYQQETQWNIHLKSLKQKTGNKPYPYLLFGQMLMAYTPEWTSPTQRKVFVFTLRT